MLIDTQCTLLDRMFGWLPWVAAEEAPVGDVPSQLSALLREAVHELSDALEQRRQHLRAVLGHRTDQLWLPEGTGVDLQAALRWQLSRVAVGSQLQLGSFEAAGRTLVKVWAPGPALTVRGDLPRPRTPGVECWVEPGPGVAVGLSWPLRPLMEDSPEALL